MASEIQADYLTGRTLYAQVRNTVGQIWNTAGVAFEAYNTANIADYDIALTEQGTASGYYAGNMPAVTAGTYNVIVKNRAGGSPAESDITVAAGLIGWNGSAVTDLTSALTTNLTTALTEGYRGAGATGSVRDLLYEILQNITEFSISGTTKTAKKLDGSTTAKTYTLNDATTPTAITETT